MCSSLCIEICLKLLYVFFQSVIPDAIKTLEKASKIKTDVIVDEKEFLPGDW